MKKLSVTRFIQEPAHCTIASSACVANYYDKTKNYESVKATAHEKITKDISCGLSTGQMGSLLNHIGFKKVTIVSANMEFLDFGWAKESKNGILKCLHDVKPHTTEDYKGHVGDICKFLQNDGFDNRIIIDYDFGSYIRESIDAGKPVEITFNWTLFFKFSKYDGNKPDPLRGRCEEHAVAVCGYDSKNVRICDSHHQYYKYRLKKYRQGFYNIKWEHLMIAMSKGDLLLPDNFERD
jgi:hypothetical protein